MIGILLNKPIHVILVLLGKEGSIIAHELEMHIKSSSKPNEVIEQFITTFKEYCDKDNKNLKKSLLPTQVENTSDSETLNALPKECLVRILLNVTSLQSFLIAYLLEKLVDFAMVE